MKDIPVAADGLGHRVRADDRRSCSGSSPRRYGAWVGGVAAGSLLLMPRVYGDAHIAGTDTPGLLLWAATAVAFWKGLHEPDARRWRVAGRACSLGPGVRREDGGGRSSLVPLLLWLVVGPTAADVFRQGGRADWIDGAASPRPRCSSRSAWPSARSSALTSGSASRQPRPRYRPLHRRTRRARSRARSCSFPLVVWIVRRLLGLGLPEAARSGASSGRRWRPGRRSWRSARSSPGSATRPGGARPCRGSPTTTRINTDRRGVLPDIQILYFGQIYEYSLPWHNAWVLIAITVPAAILLAAIVGLILAPADDRAATALPLYFLAPPR